MVVTQNCISENHFKSQKLFTSIILAPVHIWECRRDFYLLFQSGFCVVTIFVIVDTIHFKLEESLESHRVDMEFYNGRIRDTGKWCFSRSYGVYKYFIEGRPSFAAVIILTPEFKNNESFLLIQYIRKVAVLSSVRDPGWLSLYSCSTRKGTWSIIHCLL